MPQPQTAQGRWLQFFLVCLLFAIRATAQSPSPILRWHFNESSGNSAADEIHYADGLISGVFKHVTGAQGNALRLDGETSSIAVPAAKLPTFGSSFTIEAWIAIDAYPWNWAPIVDQRSGEKEGFLFGIDSFGHLGLQARVGDAWDSIVSQEQLPLKQWVYVAASLSTSGGMTLYINGKEVRNQKATGEFVAAPGQDLLIGRVRNAMLPAQWIHPKYPVWYSFDGILDEISIFDGALNFQQVTSEYSSVHAPKGDVLPYPKLPSGPSGAGPFGAYYATLKYDELWDEPRRVAPDSDVVVRFDETPIRFVSWQGTNYIPAWVTENGKWYTDEFVERGGPGCPLGGDCEPMSDKQNRYAHVRILESSSARAVIHVRYGQCEVEEYVCANPDPINGWTDVADDYYTVYPDGVAARESVAWTSDVAKIPEFQETIIINPPGTRPEDNIETDALTFVNMRGERTTYSWAHPPAIINSPEDANIQVVNLKSRYKPFQIVFPNKPLISTYRGEKTYSMFEWWNHWPVAQVKSSGISAVAPDRPSHSSLSHIEGQPYRRTSNSITKIMLDGLTDSTPAELSLLAKSWISPPPLVIKSGSFVSDGYDPAQRAFALERKKEPRDEPLHLEIRASADSPLLNPCFVLEGWGDEEPTLKVNGVKREWDGKARFGTVNTLDGAKLVIWLELKATAPISLEISANQAQRN